MDNMLRIVRALALISASLSFTGCVFLIPDRIHYELEPLEQGAPLECTRFETEDRPETIFGLALSGGGSRAAVFGAAAMEALWEHGLLGQISHISSVSGGSIAASYFAANKPACEGASSEADKETCWREFFTEFKKAMRYNYRNWMEVRQLRKFNRFLSPTRRASSLQETLDDRFLHGKTFGDLEVGDQGAREGRALERPVLLINATRYAEGRRFVFSNLCFSEPLGNGSNSSTQATESRYEPLTRRTLLARTFSRPECTRPVPSDLPISLAVATSAAFPPLIGPVCFEVPSSCYDGEPNWWHLGDGGIIDNSGVDTLEEIVVRELEDGEGRLAKALIISIDSGRVIEPERMQLDSNLRIWTRDPGRVVDVSIPRGRAYHDIVWDRLKRNLAADGIQMETIEMRYTAAKLSHWPASCKKKTPIGEAGESLAQFRMELLERLNLIPTDLSINKCDADLMEMAAHKVIHDTLTGETAQQLRDHGFTVREVQE
jgi:predicted acylesterase/phospholipase RssA